MNLASASFLVMFAVLGAVIAYFADRLGRQLGKKRLSLFGLRPRHTAELLTVAAGAVIPIFTVLVVIALSTPVREWLIHGPQLLQERDDSNRQRAQLMVQLANTKEEISNQKIQAVKLVNDNKKLFVVNQDLSGREKALKGQVDARTEELNKSTFQLSQARLQYNTVKVRLTTIQGQMSVVNKNFLTVKRSLVVTQNDLDKKQGNLDKLQKTYDSLDKQYGTLQKRYVLLQDDEKKTREDLRLDDEKVKQDDAKVAQIESDINAKQTELNNVNVQLSNTQAQLANTQVDSNINKSLFAMTRRMPVIFDVNDELARGFIPAGTSEQEARNILQRVIDSASKEAKDKGAGKNNQGYAGLVDLFNDQQQRFPVQEIENQAITHMVNSKEPLLIIARAWYNTVQGEFVPLTLEVRENPLVYKRNQAIAETLVQGSADDQQIFEQLASFGRRVQAQVKQSKMIPVSGRDETYGEVPAGQVVSLVEKIHSWGKSATLIAMASQDTYAGDSLVLKFDLRQ